MPTTTDLELRAASRSRSHADFSGTIRGCFPYWDAQYRPYTIKAIEAFPPEHLDFKPRPELLTAREMILHLPEAERAWIHVRVDGAGEDEEWVAPADDPAQGWRCTVDAPDHAGLLERLERWHRPTQAWLDKPTSELARRVTWKGPEGERTGTLHWVLDHVQEHEIHHRAQLNLYLRMLGIEPPSI